ncbi:MAG: hypothetical protein GX927_13300, partial [Lentisphaerae bacterium]|nr:hypothetical protein [Lentisphaerota bacterium]
TILLVVLLSWLPGLLAEPVCVALLPMDATAQNSADLALAELSGDADITFLERTEIDQIKKELRLSALSDFVPDPQLMQNADVFAVMLKQDFIAFDARTGVRLVDLPTISAEAVGDALRDAIAKRQSLTASKLRKLSCMPLVPANLSEKQEDLARRLETTLLRTLGNRKDFVVLERRHLLLLLNEPGAERQDLTKDLFAGALVLKLTATPEGKDDVHLKVHVYSPDGKTLLSEETRVFQSKADLDEQCQQFLSTLPMPMDSAEDKSGEARNFIYEAWFSVSHSLPGDAIASAASASALDVEQEKELCRIAAKAAHQLWQQWTKPPTERYAVAVDNLKLAARLAAKHRIFPDELRMAIRSGAALPKQREFAKLPADLQREWRESIESILETRRDTLAEYHRLAELPGEKWPDRLFALEARVEYLCELAAVAEIQWDYGYWDQYVYPELAKYVAEAEDLLPELQKYDALSNGEKMKICRQAQIKNRRLPRFRQCLDLTVVNRDLTRFYRFRAADHDAANVAVYRKMMELLASSKILPLAYHGRLGLLRLQLDFTFLASLNNSRCLEQPHARSALRKFYQDLVELFATAESVGSPQRTVEHLADVFSDSAALEYRLPIQELAMRRFAWYTPWQNDLIKGSQNWSPEERRDVYQRLAKYIEEYNNDQRLDRDRKFNNQAVIQYFQRLQKQLEKQDRSLSSVQDEIASINPFERVITPLEDCETDTRAIVFGEEDGIIYLGEYYSENVRIVRVDTKANLAVSKGSKHKLPISWHGWKIHGVILADYLAAQNGSHVFLFPKDGTSPESIDFRQYFTARCHAMIGCGDRLFLSFDGEHGHPGTVLEYNVVTKKTELLVSTLDRSVKWPLQGLQEPYAILQMLCDPSRKRLIMLMHDQPPILGRQTYTIRFQAYNWETKTWQAISGIMPITGTCWSNSFYIEDGELWLLRENDLGKINADGNWQPVFL